MNRLEQLERYRKMNKQKRIIEEARENYRKKQASKKPMTLVQEIRKSVLLDQFFTQTHF